MSASPEKVLIIRFSSVGDIVLSSLLVRAFRKRFPSCRLDYVVKEEYADLVMHNSNITSVIRFPKSETLDDLKKLRARIQQNRYDLIIDIHDSLRSRFLTFGAKRVVRINKRKLARFLLVRFKINTYDAFNGAPSVALRYLEPVRAFGVEDDGAGLECFVGEEDEREVDILVQGSGFRSSQQFIGLCPSAKHYNKMWLKERFAEVASILSRTRNQPIVLFGFGENEVVRCNEIQNHIHSLRPVRRTLAESSLRPYGEPKTLNLSGKISLTETAAMMDKCSIVVTNDSGLMHLAAARKRNVVAIFGPTVKELGFFPFGTNSVVVENNGLRCRPCTHIGLASCPKGHFKCMNDISVEQVIASANTLLQ